ncbi:MAG: 3'-5' exoribonuclease [Dethiobacter sp.]|nr:3'-5' exoribonuclease [Dethiobacter sp.]MBS3898675.1 3'-5' exoribonuclease [Dethiobacter sp.]
MVYDFVAIDFETANKDLNSACSVGLVAVKNLEIVITEYFLIQPITMDFDDENVSLHGITPEAVMDSPSFPEVWEQIKQYFEENLIIAHNAIFDMSVLKCCLTDYNLDCPNFEYLCSIPITTRACRGEGIKQSLVARAGHFGIELVDHHNALGDAITCAKLVIECVRLKNRKSLKSYCNTHWSLPFKTFSELVPMTTLNKNRRRKFKKIQISEIEANTDAFNQTYPLFGKNIVLTGELERMDRRSAMQKIANVGGINKSGVSGKTDILIVGIQDKAIVGEDGISSKEEKAYALKDKGHHIKIITEREFLDLLSNCS